MEPTPKANRLFPLAFYLLVALFVPIAAWSAGGDSMELESTGMARLRGSEPELDSLNQLLGREKTAQAQVDLLNQLAGDYLDQKHSLTFTCAQEALRLAREDDYLPGMYQAHMHLAQVQVNYTLNYNRGLDHLTQAYQLALDLQDLLRQKISLHMIGFVHSSLGNVEKAVEYYNKAIGVAQMIPDQQAVSDLNGYLGYLMEGEGDTAQALHYFQKVHEMEAAHQFKGTRPEVMTSIGRYFFLQKDHSQALEFYQKALQGFLEMGSQRWASYLYSVMAEVYLAQGDPTRATETAQTGLDLALGYQLAKETADNHRILARIHESQQHYQKALYHLQELNRVEDSVYTVEKAREIAAVQASYEQMMHNQSVEQIRKEKEMQQTRTRILAYGGGALLLLLSILSLWWYRAYRQKKAISEQLEDRVELKDLALADIVQQLRSEIEQHQATQAKLETTHSELNHFIYKSSHDLKGPLASIMGLSDIALHNATEAERLHYLELIGVSSARLSQKLDALIQATRLIEGQMEWQSLELETEVNHILAQMRAHDFSAGVGVRVEIEPQLSLHCDGHLFRTMLHHLVENAMRYKNPQVEQPFVRIAASQAGEEIRISVSDNGRGIPEHQKDKVFDLFVKSNMEFHSSGLGLYLVKKTVEKLGGRIVLQSQLGEGTTFTIYLPQNTPETTAASA